MFAIPVFSITPGGLEPLDDVKDEKFHYRWISNTLVQVINKTLFGSREEDEVSGFFILSHLWIRSYFRLG